MHPSRKTQNKTKKSDVNQLKKQTKKEKEMKI